MGIEDTADRIVDIIQRIGLIIMLGFFAIVLLIGIGDLIFGVNETIIIQNNTFEPSGAILSDDADNFIFVWINNDSKTHRVVSDDGKFDSGDLAPGQEYIFHPPSPGVYHYHDSMNPSMEGTLKVSDLHDVYSGFSGV